MAKKIVPKQLYIIAAIFAAVVCLLVWKYVSPGRKVEQAALQVTETAEKIRQEYARKVDYWGLNTQTAIDKKILTNLSYDDGKLLNALGKPVTVGSGENSDTVMPGERSFDIVYAELGMGECIALASYRFERPEETGLLQITIVGKDKSQSFGWGNEDYSLPVSRPAAKEICTNNSKVLWTME